MTDASDPITPVEIAAQRAKTAAGGPSALSRALNGVRTPQAISVWRRVPATFVEDVERITGIPRHELRPDIYPAPK
jgi:DNA-binding transcriptional regulator YdaS (Cro superfamily)